MGSSEKNRKENKNDLEEILKHIKNGNKKNIRVFFREPCSYSETKAA